jgi:hypothetical protein
LTHILEKEGVVVKAMSAATSAQSGTFRMIVNDPQKAEAVLESFGFRYEISPVIAAEVPLHPGGMNAVLNPLNKAEINIDYLYTTIDKIGRETIVVIGTDKPEEAEEALRENWISLIGDEIHSL